MSRGNKVSLALGLVSLLPVLGCGGCGRIADESAGWRKQSEEWQKKADNYEQQLKELNKQVDGFSKNLITAADHIDPFALKKLLQENKELAAVNAKFKETMDSASRGVLLLSHKDLRLSILRFKGSMVVRSWIDTDENIVFREALRSTDPTLKISYGYAVGTADEPIEILGGLKAPLKGDSQIRHDMVMERARRADAAYQNAVNTAFNEFLRDGAYETPKDGKFLYHLESRFLRSGRHELRFSIEPITPQWELTIELYEVSPQKKETKLLIRDQYNPYTVKDPSKIPPVVLYVRYLTDGKQE